MLCVAFLTQNVNHMNHDVTEVNGSNPPMLPGSFFYEKECGYKARVSVPFSSGFGLNVAGDTVTRVCTSH